MSNWIEILLLASRDAAILALATGGLLWVAGRHIPAGWRHGLWLLVAVRLLMPALPTSPVSWQRVLPAEKREDRTLLLPQALPAKAAPIPGMLSTERPTSLLAAPLELDKSPEKSVERVPEPVTAWEIIVGIWAAGVLGLLALGTLLTWRFGRRLQRLAMPFHQRKGELEILLETLGRESGWRKPPRIHITEAVDVPALFGLFRPRILMPPAALERLSETELRLVLLHELGHWRRRDLWVNLALALLQAVHWFNPLVWWAFHRTRVESERATDVWVLRRAGAEQVGTYGETLLRLLDQGAKARVGFSGMVSVVESPKDLRRRMAGIGRFSGKHSRFAVAGSLAVLLGLAAVGLTQPPKPARAADAVSAAAQVPAADTFTCRIKTSEGTRVADAEVYLELVSNLDGHQLDAVALIGKTDGTGEIKVAVRPEWRESPFVNLHLFVRHPTAGYAAILRWAPFADSPVEMILEKGLPLRFRVLNEKGMPIPNLRLRVASAQIPVLPPDRSLLRPRFWGQVPSLPPGFWNSVTDSQGRCTIDGLPPGLYYADHDNSCYAQIPGGHSEKFQHNPEAQKGEIELKLLPASMVSGTIRLPDGTPVVGASVEIFENYDYTNGGSSAEARTDAKGRYELQRLLPGDYGFLVRLNETPSADWTADMMGVSLKAGEHLGDLNPSIIKGGLISGKVTLGDTGAAVGNVAVGVTSDAASSSLQHWSGPTTGNGFFQQRVPAGKRKVYVGGPMPEGYARATGGSAKLEVDLEVVDGGTYTVDFALARESRIRGVVVNPSGEPVAGASVSCLEPKDDMSHPIKVVSDDAGKFSITLPAGTDSAQLMAESEGMVTTSGVKFPVKDEARLELKANEFASVSGRVVDAEGKPIEGALITKTDDGIAGVSKIHADKDGRFRVKNVLPGMPISFYASKGGYGQDVSSATCKAGQAVELEQIVLPRADATVAGKVVDSAGNPVPGASVEASGYPQPDGVNSPADSNGRFVLSGVVAGWLDVKATQPKKGGVRASKVRVRTGGDDIVIKLPDELSDGKKVALVDLVGKQAPPLKARFWFHSDPLPEYQPGKVRLIEFVGLDRPLTCFSNTLPPLQKLRKEIPGQELEIIVVHGAWPKEEVAEILAKDYPDFRIPLAIEPEQEAMSKAFGVECWLTVVIDRNGKVVFQSPVDWSGAKKQVRLLLGKDK